MEFYLSYNQDGLCAEGVNLEIWRVLYGEVLSVPFDGW